MILHVGHFDAAAAAWHHRCALRAAGADIQVAMAAPTHVATEADLLFGNWSNEQLHALLARADTVIVHVSCSQTSSTPEVELVDTHELSDLLPYRSKMVLWANGSAALRARPAEYKRRYSGFRGVATNQDIAQHLGFTWMPACIDVAVDAGQLQWATQSKAFRILGHAFSDQFVKNVAQAKEACEKASWTYRGLDGLSLHDCLIRKVKCTATFDHMQGYFGLSAMEATAMGQPCAVGYSDEALLALLAFGCEPPPWRRTRSVTELVTTLQEWDDDLVAMAQEGASARRWHEKYFTNARKASRFLEWL